MSENNPKHETPAMEGTDPTTPGNPNLPYEWAYSGKAMRAQCVLYWTVTISLAGLMTFLKINGTLGGADLLVGGIVVVGLLALWAQFICVYLYRTWTIRYRLTEQRLDTIQGFFTKTTDTTELLYIEDMRLIVTLWDRLLNGGVGKIVVYSSSDKTDPQLYLTGIENPQNVFDILNAARAKVRGKRGFITGG